MWNYLNPQAGGAGDFPSGRVINGNLGDRRVLPNNDGSKVLRLGPPGSATDNASASMSPPTTTSGIYGGTHPWRQLRASGLDYGQQQNFMRAARRGLMETTPGGVGFSRGNWGNQQYFDPSTNPRLQSAMDAVTSRYAPVEASRQNLLSARAAVQGAAPGEDRQAALAARLQARQGFNQARRMARPMGR